VDGDVITVERVIKARPEAIFSLIADASEHPKIDGSGTVKQVKAGAPERLVLGSTFGMSMKLGIGYSMMNKVIEFEENRRIAWQTTPPGPMAKFTAGRIWRYELDPLDDGSTRVRESWDVSKDHQKFFLKLVGMPAKTKTSMEKTLEKIEEITTS
jgi:hypothetical protein